MCAYVYVYMCVCVHVCMCACVHMYMCTCVYVCMCACVRVTCECKGPQETAAVDKNLPVSRTTLHGSEDILNSPHLPQHTHSILPWGRRAERVKDNEGASVTQPVTPVTQDMT